MQDVFSQYSGARPVEFSTSASWISTLDHEVLDNSVKLETIVVAPSRQFSEITACHWCMFPVKFQLHHTHPTTLPHTLFKIFLYYSAKINAHYNMSNSIICKASNTIRRSLKHGPSWNTDCVSHHSNTVTVELGYTKNALTAPATQHTSHRRPGPNISSAWGQGL